MAALLFLQAANPNAAGTKALEDGDYLAAVEAFTKAVASDPADYSAHFNLALAYSFLGKDAEGVAEYRKTLELKPGLYEAQLNAGILLLRQKKPAEAVELLQAAAEQKSGEFRPRYYLAEALMGTGDAVKAEENYRVALDADGKSAGAHLGLGRALAQQDKLAEAAPQFQQAAQLDAKYRDGLLELAVLYEKKGQIADAIEIYRQFPGNPAAEERLGALLLENKQYSDAIPGLEQAYAQSPTAANRLALAEAYLFNRQPEQAIPLLEKAVGAEPANYDLRLIYARALRDRRQFPAAAAQFQQAVKLKPEVAQSWNELGGVLYLADDYGPALAAFERARQLGENTAGNAFMRAIILDKAHQLKPALEAYQQFLSMSLGKNPDQEFQARQRVRILQREIEKR